MRYCLPLSKSSWLEGRIGTEKYQDCFTLVKDSIDLLNAGEVYKILLLSDFKSKQSEKSELRYMLEICLRGNIQHEKLYVQEYGYDTLSQIQYALDLCSREGHELLILSSMTHYPRVRWITMRLNKKYNVIVKHRMVLGIPRPRDVLFDIPLIFLYPIIDLLGFSENFTRHMKVRRDKGYLV